MTILPMVRALGHIGVFSGLYVTAACVCLFQLSGSGVLMPSAAALAVLLLSTAAYALDRVKLRNAWIDPADIESQPQRYRFLTAHPIAVRSAAFVMLAAGATVGLTVSRWAPLAALLIPAGVGMYAAKPRGSRARLKDIIAIKNAYVAAGIVGFSLIVVVALVSPSDSILSHVSTALDRFGGLAVAALLLSFRVYLDAALCDLDDVAADRRFGTSTFATTMGSARAWRYTGVLRGALVAAIALGTPCPFRVRLVWAAITLGGMLALRLRQPDEVRDWVDLRLPVESLVATIALWA